MGKKRKKKGNSEKSRRTEAARARRAPSGVKVIRGGQAVELERSQVTKLGRVPEYALGGASPKVKVRKVLSPQAKRHVRRVVAVVLAVVVASIAVILVVTGITGRNGGGPGEVSEPVSLVGITPAGKAAVEEAGTFMGFLDSSGVEAAKLYDTDITDSDAPVLEGRGQLSADGEIAYNAEASGRAKSGK